MIETGSFIIALISGSCRYRSNLLRSRSPEQFRDAIGRSRFIGGTYSFALDCLLIMDFGRQVRRLFFTSFFFLDRCVDLYCMLRKIANPGGLTGFNTVLGIFLLIFIDSVEEGSEELELEVSCVERSNRVECLERSWRKAEPIESDLNAFPYPVIWNRYTPKQ